MEPLAVDVEEAARLVSVSPHTIRRAIRSGRLAASRCGRRVLVPIESLRILLRGDVPPIQPGTDSSDRTQPATQAVRVKEYQQ
jgi:excisionase family DNA binding protein